MLNPKKLSNNENTCNLHFFHFKTALKILVVKTNGFDKIWSLIQNLELDLDDTFYHYHSVIYSILLAKTAIY